MSKDSRDGAGQDKETFAQAVLAAFRAAAWRDKLDYDAADSTIDTGAGGVLYLGNVYQDWLKAKTADEKQAQVTLLVRLATQGAQSGKDSNDFSKVSPNLLPTLRNRAFIENLWLVTGFPQDYASLCSRPFCDELSVILTINMPESIAMLPPDQLKTWGKTFDEVMVTAMSNLRAFKKPDFQPLNGFYILNSDTFYDPSVLLMPEAFQALTLKGEPVVVAISRTLVAVAGADDTAGMKAMAEFVEEQYPQDARPISYTPLILHQGGWKAVANAPETTPSLHRLQQLNRLTDYNSQQASLNAYNAKQGRDIYVGQIEAIEDNGRLLTWSSLVCGITTLLPECDVVILAPADMKHPFARRFTDVMRVCRGTSLEPDTWPPLHVFATGPSDDEIKQLRETCKAPSEFPDAGFDKA